MNNAASLEELTPRMTPQERNARILSVLGYFGLAPFLWLFSSIYRKDRLLEYHVLHSLAFSFLSLCLLAFEIIPDVSMYAVFGFDLQTTTRPLLEAGGFYRTVTLIFTGTLMLAGFLWSVGWSAAVYGALRGRMQRLPFVSWVASVKWAVSLGAISSLIGYAAVLGLVGIGIDSYRIANTPRDSADVYVLYTMGGYIPVEGLYETYTPPGWSVTMAFYPLVRAGIEKFGNDRVNVLPLTEDNFNQAIHYGRFIFIASHGGSTPGSFYSAAFPYDGYGPANVPQEYVGDRLQFVYIAGCDAGRLETEWRQVLRLEDAIMFDRTSYVDEHMLWVWFKSPAVIAGLE